MFLFKLVAPSQKGRGMCNKPMVTPPPTATTVTTAWNTSFLEANHDPACVALQTHAVADRALIILNQSFPATLLHRLWANTQWRCCADGGANRLYDLFGTNEQSRVRFLPDLIKGDLDSIRDDVHAYYAAHGVPVVHDPDQDSTDLMKCVFEIDEKEKQSQAPRAEIIILGGLSGRLDQTVHTLSYLHKLRKTRPRVYAVTEDNVGWVLDAGEHVIHINHELLGKTCGLLPVGIDSTTLTTSGLRWNLDGHESSFDGMVSTSNHLVPENEVVRIRTSKPIWWTVELKIEALGNSD